MGGGDELRPRQRQGEARQAPPGLRLGKMNERLGAGAEQAEDLAEIVRQASVRHLRADVPGDDEARMLEPRLVQRGLADHPQVGALAAQQRLGNGLDPGQVEGVGHVEAPIVPVVQVFDQRQAEAQAAAAVIHHHVVRLQPVAAQDVQHLGAATDAARRGAEGGVAAAGGDVAQHLGDVELLEGQEGVTQPPQPVGQVFPIDPAQTHCNSPARLILMAGSTNRVLVSPSFLSIG